MVILFAKNKNDISLYYGNEAYTQERPYFSQLLQKLSLIILCLKIAIYSAEG